MFRFPTRTPDSRIATVRWWLRLGALACVVVVLPSACETGSANRRPQAGERVGPGQLTPETIGRMVIAFGDDHVIRLVESIGSDSPAPPPAERRGELNALVAKNVDATVGIATSPNPVIGIVDMTVMVTMMHESVRRSILDATLTRDERFDPDSYEVDDAAVEALADPIDRAILLAMARSKDEVRAIASRVLYPEQLAELDVYMARWWRLNPDRRMVTHVRLQDFAAYRASTVEVVRGGPRNILGLLQLDPFAGMDPAARELAQSRLLVERMTYMVQRLPVLAALQARGVLYETLGADEIAQLQDRVGAAERTFATIGDAVDRLPRDLERERDAALRQAADLLEIERTAALEQIASLVETERTAAIAELDATLDAQREAFATALDERTESLRTMIAELDGALARADQVGETVRDAIVAVDEIDTTKFQTLVETTNEGVASVERTLSAVERVLGRDGELLDGEAIGAGLESGASSLTAVVDHAFNRALQLLGIALVGVFVLAAAIRLLPRRSA